MTDAQRLIDDIGWLILGLAMVAGMVVVILIGIAKLAAPALPHVGYWLVGVALGVPVWCWSVWAGLL